MCHYWCQPIKNDQNGIMAQQRLPGYISENPKTFKLLLFLEKCRATRHFHLTAYWSTLAFNYWLGIIGVTQTCSFDICDCINDC